jgi:hypothetical protein
VFDTSPSLDSSNQSATGAARPWLVLPRGAWDEAQVAQYFIVNPETGERTPLVPQAQPPRGAGGA